MRSLLWLVLFTLCTLHISAAQETAAPEDEYLRSPRLGITFISSADQPLSETRYQHALELGAGWNRWPVYWDRVETEAGEFDWTNYDRVVQADLEHGLNINAILLGMPAFHRDGERPAGLNEPIFDNGSDLPREGLGINPDNPWAVFVYEAVNRYKPGGVLALENDWDDEWGIRVWEIWNEPDFAQFWTGTFRDYARLLKVAYIVAHYADPETNVMFGGLIYNDPQGANWLAQVLAIFQNDPFVEEFNWYLDMVSVHNYNYAWRSGWMVLWVRQTLIAYGLQRPIWLNETGVPVWDDYPGPSWDAAENERILRATSAKAADFLIQSAAYAWAEGAEVVFFHQLYDDCGNQPPGTTFPPHEGEVCREGEICFGDAYGLFRNESDSVCFNQHPNPGTPRPTADAYRLLADIFGTETFANPRQFIINRNVVTISFDRPERDERLLVVWNRTLREQQIAIPVTGDSATLYTLDGEQRLQPERNFYLLDLPPAVQDNYPFLNPGDSAGIGGSPLILIETGVNLAQPIPTPTPPPTPEATPESTSETGA